MGQQPKQLHPQKEEDASASSQNVKKIIVNAFR